MLIFMQMFDGYNNHAAEGANVVICLDGYRIQDSVGLNRKVREPSSLSIISIKRMAEQCFNLHGFNG